MSNHSPNEVSGSKMKYLRSYLCFLSYLIMAKVKSSQDGHATVIKTQVNLVLGCRQRRRKYDPSYVRTQSPPKPFPDQTDI